MTAPLNFIEECGTCDLDGALGFGQLLPPISANSFPWDTPNQAEPYHMLPNQVMSVQNSAKMSSWCTSTPDSFLSLMTTTAAKTGPAERRRRPNPPKVLMPLPWDFEPSDYSVLCGKGGENYNAIGKFHGWLVLAAELLPHTT